MIQDLDIIKSFNDILITAFPYPIYLDDVKDGFKTPSFFVQVFTNSRVIGKNLLNNATTIILTYFPPHEKQHEKIKDGYKVANKLRQLYYINPLTIGNRKLDFDNIQITRAGINNELFQLELELYYRDYIEAENTKDIDIMTNLHINK